MSRNEFTKPTKRDALKRSGGICEADGGLYGLSEGQRCHRQLALGVEFDHVILDANSHDNSLGNCKAICIPCHRYKTAKHDIPVAAKTLRQQDKNAGIRKRSTMPGSRNSGWRRKMDGTVERRT
jgi:5-methylcytosine-specific restriction endonuclease McrA